MSDMSCRCRSCLEFVCNVEPCRVGIKACVCRQTQREKTKEPLRFVFGGMFAYAFRSADLARLVGIIALVGQQEVRLYPPIIHAGTLRGLLGNNGDISTINAR